MELSPSSGLLTATRKHDVRFSIARFLCPALVFALPRSFAHHHPPPTSVRPFRQRPGFILGASLIINCQLQVFAPTPPTESGPAILRQSADPRVQPLLTEQFAKKRNQALEVKGEAAGRWRRNCPTSVEPRRSSRHGPPRFRKKEQRSPLTTFHVAELQRNDHPKPPLWNSLSRKNPELHTA